jgi:predicted dehydrogenase
MGKPETAGVYGVTFDKIGPRNDVKMLKRYRAADAGTICDVEDSASALIKFKNGNAMAVEVSFTLHTSNEKIYCEIFGDKAGMEVAPEIKISGSEEGYNVDMTPVFTKETNEFEEMFGREIRHFIDCVSGAEECISPVEDGVDLMKILDAIYESALTGKEVRFE